MAVHFLIPAFLRPYAGGRNRVDLPDEPATVIDALRALRVHHPGVWDRVLTEEGAVRQHVNVFVGDESIRYTGGLATPVPADAEISIVPAVSGGRPRVRERVRQAD